MRPMDPARQAALDAGESHFYATRPCRNGHLGRKVTATGACLQCCNEAAKRWQHTKYPERKPRPPKQGRRLSPRKRAQLASEPFYAMSAPCKYGHLGRRHTASSLCEQCVLEDAAEQQAITSARPLRYRTSTDPAHQAAVAAGEKTYLSAKPCQHGHTAPRKIITGRCCECVAISLRAVRARPEARARERATHRAFRARQRQANPTAKPPGIKKGTSRTFVEFEGETLSLNEACERAGILKKSVMNDVSRSKIAHQASFDRLCAAKARREERAKLRAEGKLPKSKQDESTGPDAENWRARLDELKTQLPPPSAPKRKRGRQAGLRVDKNHYIDKEVMLNEVLSCQARQQISNAMGAMLLLLAKRYFLRANWRGYSCVQEFRDGAVLQAMAAVWKFKAEKSRNPFCYFTEVMKHAALKVLKKEKAQWAIGRESAVIYEIGLEQQAPGSTTRGSRIGRYP